MIRANFLISFQKILGSLNLTPLACEIIEHQYIDLVRATESEYRMYRVLYFLLTNVITIAGVIIAALLSLEKMTWEGHDNAPSIIFWIGWGISLAIPIANKILYIFNIPERYTVNKSLLRRYYSEGDAFLGKYGDYAGPGDTVSKFLFKVGTLRDDWSHEPVGDDA